jgi:hypothetical protein
MIKAYHKTTVVLLFAAAFVILIPNNVFSKADIPPGIQLPSSADEMHGSPVWGQTDLCKDPANANYCQCVDVCDYTYIGCTAGGAITTVILGPFGLILWATCDLAAFECYTVCEQLYPYTLPPSATTPASESQPSARKRCKKNSDCLQEEICWQGGCWVRDQIM